MKFEMTTQETTPAIYFIFNSFKKSDWVIIQICRLSASGQNKANDLTSLLMLHSIATAFKSLLRPSDLSCHDKSPADSLSGRIDRYVTEKQNKVKYNYRCNDRGSERCRQSSNAS